MTDKIYSTSSVKSLYFAQHGSVEMKLLDSGVLAYKATGPFNLETLVAIDKLHHNEVFIELLKHQQQWSEVIEFHVSCLFTHEAIETLGKYIVFNRQQGIPLKGVAFVIPKDMEGASLTVDLIAPLYKKSSFPFKRFTDVSEGLLWAEKLLQVSS